MISKPITTAVILAGGMGLRLRSLGAQIPKGFLRLGDRPIIEESIWRLQAHGIRRIVIVTGHQAEYYERLRAQYPRLIETVHNPFYAESGSMYSLSCVRDRVTQDFLLLESDLVYEQAAIRQCLGFPLASAVLLSGLTGARDAVFVEAKAGRLVSMSKNREQLGGNIHGELVGICKISRQLFQVMLSEADKHFESSPRMDYETDCLVAAADRTPVPCHLVNDLCWCEIDDEAHLSHAKQVVYPSVMRRDSRVRAA